MLPSGCESEFGTIFGRPFASKPVFQVWRTNALPRSNLPSVRSSTYNIPLRSACNSSLRGWPCAVHKDQVFGGIPIVAVVRRELTVPLAAAGIRIESDHATCKQVVPARTFAS
jgi:hypothetical protein